MDNHNLTAFTACLLLPARVPLTLTNVPGEMGLTIYRPPYLPKASEWASGV